jgi:hypothetical protein
MRNLLIRLALAGVLLSAGPSAASAETSVLFAVIGDYGLAGTAEADVAALVKSWAPDLIITTGDNNYYGGAASTIDANIGQYYAEFIYPYTGAYGPGGTVNRFFPSLGNHDWDAPGAQPYLDYFTLPGNERYYDFVRGPVHFFALDSDPSEPDGRSATSVQAQWLQARLATSTAPWKVVYMHHPPYSSANHGSSVTMQWPYAAWGASAVLAGHDHTYERVTLDDFPYFVNGLGGAARYEFRAPLAGSQVRFQADHGAMRVQATEQQIAFEFVTRTGAVVDRYTLYAAPDAHLPDPPGPVTATAVSGAEIDLAWVDNASNEGGFRLEQWTGSAWGPVVTLGANATAHRVGGLAPLTSYSFRVVARGAAGDSAPSAVATAQTLAGGPPAAPGGLTAQAAASGQINLAWTDNSSNEAGFSVEQSLDGVAFGGIAALDRDVRTHAVTGLAPDTTYHYRVRAFNGSGSSGYSNTATARTVPPANLEVTEMFNPPSSAAPGSSFGARDWVINRGPGPAGPSYTRYYLSLDTARDAADILLGGGRTVGPLALGQTSKGSITVTVPSPIPAGLYYLLACADDLGEVIEGSEANNCRTSLTRVQIGAPAPTVTLTVTIAGTGTGSISGPGIACGSDCSESLPSGTPVTLTASPGLNSTFTGWTGGGCGATSPCSTVITASVGITATFAAAAPGDLVIAAVGTPPASAAQGASFAATDTVANSGPGTVGPSTTRYYLAPSPTRTAAAVLLVGTRSVAALGPSASSPGGTTVTIPSSLASGSYYLLACADDLGQAAESNEANNCGAAPATVQVTAPPPPPASGADLIVTEMFNPPALAAQGSSFGARDWVLNQGTASAGSFVTRYYLSLDTVRNAADILLGGSRTSSGIAPGQTSKGSITVTVPGSTPAGLYYLLACADDTYQVGEANEANNCRASQTRVQVGN